MNILMGQAPCFWMRDHRYLAVSLLGCVSTFVAVTFGLPGATQLCIASDYTDNITAAKAEHDATVPLAQIPLIYAAETLGLATLSVVGARNAVLLGLHPLVYVRRGNCVQWWHRARYFVWAAASAGFFFLCFCHPHWVRAVAVIPLTSIKCLTSDIVCRRRAFVATARPPTSLFVSYALQDCSHLV